MKRCWKQADLPTFSDELTVAAQMLVNPG